MGIEFIERRRREHVKVEAQKLFETIVDHIITQTPAGSYEFSARYKAHAPVIDDMIFQRAKDLFQEIGSTLLISRTSEFDVEGRVAVPSVTELKVEKLKKFFWSRVPGKFVNKHTGDEVKLSTPKSDGAVFTGTVREWYETFVETLIDAGNSIHRVAKEVPESVYVGPDLSTILECSVLYRPTFNSAEPHVGTLCNRYKIFKDETLKNSAFVCFAKDGTKYEVEVEVLDMNII